MILEKKLTIEEILVEMNKLKNKIYSLETVLHKKINPLKGVTYKDIVTKNHTNNDIILNSIIKVDELESELDATIESYNGYKNMAIREIQKMRKEKTVDEMIVLYRDKLHWKWKDICKITNYSIRQCHRKYNLIVDNDL